MNQCTEQQKISIYPVYNTACREGNTGISTAELHNKQSPDEQNRAEQTCRFLSPILHHIDLTVNALDSAGHRDRLARSSAVSLQSSKAPSAPGGWRNADRALLRTLRSLKRRDQRPWEECDSQREPETAPNKAKPAPRC